MVQVMAPNIEGVKSFSPLETPPGRILVYAPYSLKSIKLKIQPILEGMADRGHHLTIVMPHFQGYQHENVTVINVEGVIEGTVILNSTVL